MNLYCYTKVFPVLNLVADLILSPKWKMGQTLCNNAAYRDSEIKFESELLKNII